MCVVSGFLVVTSLVKPGGFAMVLRRVLMVLRCFDVMFRCLLRHFILQDFFEVDLRV
jgi:coenzyme F420-reducing hydrogenase alpha subunit